MSRTPSNADPAAGIQQCLALLQAGRADAMEALAQQLCAQHPGSGSAWQILGIARLTRGNAAGAVEALTRAADLSPDDAGVWDNLGAALNAAREFPRAADCYARSLALRPGDARVLSNAAANAGDAGHHGQAESLANEALRADPTLAHAQLSRGNALIGLGRNAEAIDALHAALQLAPTLPQAHLSLGKALQLAGNALAAINATRRALELAPNYADAHQNLGRLHHDLGQMAPAAAHYRAALQLKPQRLDAWSGWLYCLAHDGSVDAAQLFAAHRQFGEFVERPWRARWGGWPNTRDIQRRLRVGFVSGDLREHAVAHFVEPIWRHLDRDAVEIVAFSNAAHEDAQSAVLKQLADQWHAVAALSDDALDALIRELRIDILFDLSGHTGGHRLGVFARKPAPLQVAWIGYPNTTGMSAIDYRLVGRRAAPPGELDAVFSEKLVSLPLGTVFAPPADSPPVNTLPALSRGYFTLGTFNRPIKLTDAVIALWCRVLHALLGSRMLIGAVPDAHVRADLVRRFAAQGIDAARLDLRPRVGMRAYLELHHEIDFVLDTFPFTGGTTTNHALWMGVPTLTLTGDTLPHRQGAAIMARAGLPAWITATPDEFVARAQAIAADPAALDRVRRQLRETLAAEGEAEAARAAALVARALRMMWARWCAGEPATAFDVGD